MKKNKSEKAKPPTKPKRKRSRSSGTDRLTPSELASLKKDMKQFSKYAKGKFKDLA